MSENRQEKIVYHATRNRFMQAIKKEGLKSQSRKSYEGQVGDGLVYFAFDSDCAASYVECADNIPESWEDDEIIVLAVNMADLDNNFICKDPNLTEDDDSTFAYKLEVNPDKIGILNFENDKIEPILNVKRLNDKYYY